MRYSIVATTAFPKGNGAQKDQFYDVFCKLNYVVGKNQFSLNKEFQLPQKATEWTTFLRDPHGILLLGKLAGKRDHAITIDLLLIDLARSEPVVTAPKIISKLGEQAQISVKSHPETVSVTLKVNETVNSNLYDFPSSTQ